MPTEPGDKAARFKQVEALFEAAQQQPDDQRRAFLRQACPDDPALRAEVESLLRADFGSHLIDGSPLSSIAERAPALKPGDKLGNFEIVAMIGRGGMGEVYRARDLRLKRDVAIKTLPPGFAGDRDRIARFEREARAASAQNHPNIVSVYDIGTEGGVSFIVSELVEGETLARVIQRGSLPLRKLIEVTTQICDGLAAAHAAGVIHRDLKPGNIMLTRDGRIKILDFGLARQDHAHGVDSTTIEASHPGIIIGTPGYMSPEQVRGEPTDARSDIFSLGVILYETATGQRAFRGTSSIEVMNSILKDDPPSLPVASPPSLDRITRRCLEKEPPRRFQTATDLGFALQSTALPQPTTVLGNPPKRAWVWWAVLGAAALAGAVYWLVARQVRPAAPPEITFRRLTNDAGLTTGAAISPDGKLVAYASDRADPSNLDIWVQQADGGGLARLTDDAADDYDPSVSPDATQIAFRSERNGRGIYIAPALGGEARLVIPEGRGPRFSPDGQKLMYWTGPKESGRVDGSRDIKFWVRPLAGGEAKQIGADCRLFDRTAVWSPDSNQVLFLGICGQDLSRASQPENYGISAWVDTLDGKGLKQNRELYALWRTIHSPPRIDQWVANPSRLLIPVPVGDATSIAVVRVSADGTRVEGPRQSLTFASGKAASVSAALNGRIALSAGTSESHIWSLPFGGTGSSTGDLKQLTSGPAGEFFPALSADGKKLSFLSIRANSQRLFYKDLATGHEKEVSTEGYRYDTPLINRDGTKILCVQYPSPESWRNFVFEVQTSGGLSKKVWDKATFSWLWALAPDEANLLLTGESGSGIDNLDLKTLERTPFLSGGWDAAFSPDGRWVTFGSPRGTFIAPFRKADVPRSEWIPISDNEPVGLRFSSDGKSIFFISSRDGFRCVWAQRLRADMHPDGKPFPVYHSHERKATLAGVRLGVGPHAIVFERKDETGNVWLLDSADGGAK